MPNEIWWKWANFAVLAAGLGFLIGKNAPAFFRGRTESIQREITEAAAVRMEAEARATQIEQRIGNLETEVAGLRSRSHEEMNREGERIAAETQAQMQKIQRQAEAEIASAGKHAAQELKAFSASLAIDLAAQRLQGGIDPVAHDRLADAFVGDLRNKAALN